MTSQLSPYYLDKTAALADVLGATEVLVEDSSIVVDGRRYPVIDDVIVLLEPQHYTQRVAAEVGSALSAERGSADLASDIQFTFGLEWSTFAGILPEHEEEFRDYFDLVDLVDLSDARICDLGCGTGRWSYFLRNRCRQMILVDFSDSIFVARENLRDCSRALFFMADLTTVPFRSGCADLVICLGVLHHLPVPALSVVRRLQRLAPRLLIYVYYAVDNRPAHFRALLAIVTALRQVTFRIRGRHTRSVIAWSATLILYAPLLIIGRLLSKVGSQHLVPLYDSYSGKSLRRIEQDAYDRFFTRIEQRISRSSIEQLSDTFDVVSISPNKPYWHFVCISSQ